MVAFDFLSSTWYVRIGCLELFGPSCANLCTNPHGVHEHGPGTLGRGVIGPSKIRAYVLPRFTATKEHKLAADVHGQS